MQQGPFKNKPAMPARQSPTASPRISIVILVWQELQNPPQALQGVVKVASGCVRTNILRHPLQRRPLLAKYHFGFLNINQQARCVCFSEHPGQGTFGKFAFIFGVTATDIRVNTGEPHLLDVLAIQGLSPHPVLIHATLLIDCQSLPSRFDDWILSCEGKNYGIVNPADRANRIPNTYKMQWAFSRE